MFLFTGLFKAVCDTKSSAASETTSHVGKTLTHLVLERFTLVCNKSRRGLFPMMHRCDLLCVAGSHPDGAADVPLPWTQHERPGRQVSQLDVKHLTVVMMTQQKPFIL